MLANLVTATTHDKAALSGLTSTNQQLMKQVKEAQDMIANIRAQMANGTTQSEKKRGPPNARKPRTDQGSYCWTHGSLFTRTTTVPIANTLKTRSITRQKQLVQTRWEATWKVIPQRNRK